MSTRFDQSGWCGCGVLLATVSVVMFCLAGSKLAAGLQACGFLVALTIATFRSGLTIQEREIIFWSSIFGRTIAQATYPGPFPQVELRERYTTHRSLSLIDYVVEVVSAQGERIPLRSFRDRQTASEWRDACQECLESKSDIGF